VTAKNVVDIPNEYGIIRDSQNRQRPRYFEFNFPRDVLIHPRYDLAAIRLPDLLARERNPPQVAGHPYYQPFGLQLSLQLHLLAIYGMIIICFHFGLAGLHHLQVWTTKESRLAALTSRVTKGLMTCLMIEETKYLIIVNPPWGLRSLFP
jgi:hypothetical protein